MFRRFNERQWHWRNDLSQIARIFLSLSFDLFLVLLVASLCIYSSWYYVFLGVLLVIYESHKYRFPQLKWITISSFILILLILIPSSFQSHLRGEVRAVLYDGIVVGRTFIYTESEDYKLGDVIEADLIQVDAPIKAKYNNFDELTYKKGKGVYYFAKAQHIQMVDHRMHLRNKAITFVSKYGQDFYPYLLLGLKTDESERLSDMASSLAILHIFAISGMHFTLLFDGLKKVLSYVLDEPFTKIVSILIMTIYAICLEGNVAAWRAYLMMLCRLLGSKNDNQNFGLVGIFFLLCNPQIFYQMSFIYSFSLYFLVLVTKHLKYSSLYICLGSMVISLYFQYELLPLGFLFGLMFSYLISILFPLFMVDVLLFGKLGYLCFYLYEGLLYVMNMACKYSFSIIVGQPVLVLVIAFYLSYVYSLHQLDLHCLKRYFLIPISLFVFMYLTPYLNPMGYVCMVDVGQGDCILIGTPFSKEHLLIDTGGMTSKDIATQTLIPFFKYLGIKKIDDVYISHQDFDHCGSLESLKANFKVGRVIERFDCKEYDLFTFKQLNPQTSNNENDNSLVIYTSIGGLNYLFTGDISSEVEKILDLKDIDVLKVSHHGSNSSTCNEFLEKTTPKLALISVGKYNNYGHPSKKVLSRLNAYGSQIYRTDEQSHIMIYYLNDTSYIEMNP